MEIRPPSFIITPYQLIADERIKPLDQTLYGVIYWFSKLKNEKCTAGNDMLAKLVKSTPGAVGNALNNMEKCGYIKRTFKDRNRRVRDEIIPLIDFGYTSSTAETITTEVSTETDTEAGKEINELIKLFEPNNPSYERLFSNKTQRAVLERMVRKHTDEKVRRMIKFAVQCHGKEMAPVITTPLQLETKLGSLVAYLKRETSKTPKMVTI